MPQVFHPSFNTISRVSIFGAVFFVVALVVIAGIIVRSPYVTEADVIREQPVQFSHQHHVRDCGIDCRYCHTTVEDSAFAGLPSTDICMNCHAYLFTDARLLEPVRESFRTNTPIQWTRVHDLPDFAYFNHAIHVRKGIGCAVCHGQVDQMPLMWREHTLHMEWCLDCHRNPEKYVRPREEVFSMQWEPPGNFSAEELIREYHIREETDCSICHR